MFLALLAALSVLAGSAGAATAGRGTPPPPPFPTLPGSWSHAEINVKIKRTPHTLILDRGRITQASAVQVTLRESDGTLAVIPLAPDTLITLGRAGRVTIAAAEMRRGMHAETMRIDGGAAVRVRVTLRP